MVPIAMIAPDSVMTSFHKAWHKQWATTDEHLEVLVLLTLFFPYGDS